uniref:Uncharacterized protein n=1 Tax=Janibacter limosus TaxID=53458 RepID=A0AC61U2J5_9MICO|nr:hypothetical protein [Janibacter limosus]
MKKLATIVAASALTLGLAGCGGGNDAEKTVESFGQALKDKDFKTVCDTIDPELVKTIEGGLARRPVLRRRDEGQRGRADRRHRRGRRDQHRQVRDRRGREDRHGHRQEQGRQGAGHQAEEGRRRLEDHLLMT